MTTLYTKYPLVLDDGQRNLSKRPGQTADCTVRAFAIVTGLSYDLIYETLAKAGRKPCQGFESDVWLKKRRGRVFGGLFKPVEIRALRQPMDQCTIRPVSGKLTPSTFASVYPEGRYLLETPNHVWCQIDGIAHDLWRVKEQSLTGAWRWHPSP